MGVPGVPEETGCLDQDAPAGLLIVTWHLWGEDRAVVLFTLQTLLVAVPAPPVTPGAIPLLVLRAEMEEDRGAALVGIRVCRTLTRVTRGVVILVEEAEGVI